MYNKSGFETLKEKYADDKKLSKKLSIETIINIINTLEDKGIEDEEVSQMLDGLMGILNDYDNSDKTKRKAYRKGFVKLRKYLEKEYKLIENGLYTGTGVGIGCALGAGMNSIEGLIGTGMAIGICLGVAIGYYLDKKAEKDGRVY